MHVDPVAVTAVSCLIALLIGIIGWFVRKDYTRLESGLREERDARIKEVKEERAARELALDKERARVDAELKNERDARAKDKHDIRDELARESALRQQLEVKIASEYVNDERLARALDPLTQAMGRFRDDIKELFTKVNERGDR